MPASTGGHGRTRPNAARQRGRFRRPETSARGLAWRWSERGDDRAGAAPGGRRGAGLFLTPPARRSVQPLPSPLLPPAARFGVTRARIREQEFPRLLLLLVVVVFPLKVVLARAPFTLRFSQASPRHALRHQRTLLEQS